MGSFIHYTSTPWWTPFSFIDNNWVGVKWMRRHLLKLSFVIKNNWGVVKCTLRHSSKLSNVFRELKECAKVGHAFNYFKIELNAISIVPHPNNNIQGYLRPTKRNPKISKLICQILKEDLENPKRQYIEPY